MGWTDSDFVTWLGELAENANKLVGLEPVLVPHYLKKALDEYLDPKSLLLLKELKDRGIDAETLRSLIEEKDLKGEGK